MSILNKGSPLGCGGSTPLLFLLFFAQGALSHKRKNKSGVEPPHSKGLPLLFLHFCTGCALAQKEKQKRRRAAALQSEKRQQVVTTEKATTALIGIIMGSKSDWDTMRHAAEMLDKLQVPHEARVVSAHRTPDLLCDYAKSAEGRGLRVLIAGAGGAAHLPGMAAAMTVLPVLGVPVESKVLRGVDSLLSIVQMPAGIPVGTLAIGQAGATNAALLAAAILAIGDPALRERLRAFREQQTRTVLETTL